jgi:hypothetical protein
VARQNNIEVQDYGEAKFSPHDVKGTGRQRKKKDLVTRYTLQHHVHSDLLPPTRLHILLHTISKSSKWTTDPSKRAKTLSRKHRHRFPLS